MSYLYSWFRKSADGSKLEVFKPLHILEPLEYDSLALTEDLEVGGDAEVTGTLEVTGNSTLGGTLGVTGATTLAGLTATGPVIIAGVTYSSGDGSPEGVVTGNRKGDQYTDYTNSNLYIFTGTAAANTGWKLVTRATE